jgi:dipeptidyl-peptidase-4
MNVNISAIRSIRHAHAHHVHSAARAAGAHVLLVRTGAVVVGLLLHAIAPVRGQQLTVERIFGGELTPSTPSVTFMADGRRLMRLEPNGDVVDVWMESVAGERRERIIDGGRITVTGSDRPIVIEEVIWSNDEQRALLYTNSQRVWRLNTKGIYYVWDRATGRTVPLSRNEGWQQFAKFSPDGAQVAFVRGNNIFVADPFAGRELRLTSDGGEDIINGATDWVYEEELDLRDAFRWSPDGRRIAFWRFDQSPIRPFWMLDEMELYPRLVPVRYPKAGTANSSVDIRVIDVATGHLVRIDTGDEADTYLARMDWAGSDELVIQRLARAQDRLDVLLASATTGQSRTILTETDSAWVDVDNDLTWLRNGRQFLWTSERDGFNHVYLYGRDGRLIRQVTDGDWDVIDFLGANESGSRIWFTSSEASPLERQLYSIGIDGRGRRRITRDTGWHAAELAPDARHLVDTWSRAGAPPVVRIITADGRTVRVIEDNAEVAARIAQLNLQTPEFFSFTTTDGVALNGWLIKPPDFDATRRHPVLMYVYGGPNSQTVTDAWGGSRYLWHQLLAQHGFVVASIDNRGTGARGRDFRKVTFLQLGKWETHDQIEAARWLAARTWADPERIGIWGWSYGGFMTTLSMMNGDPFRAGVAVAPVTDWRLYDTVYTERFMRTPRTNPEGYDANSPLLRADRLDGRLLLIHGTGDDNVHIQNTVRLADALQAAGKPFDLMVYPNRTHSITGGNTSVHLFNTMTDWVLRFLAGDDRPRM